MVAKGQDYDGESKSPDTGMLATKPSSTVDQVNLPVCDFRRSGRSGACGDLSELVPYRLWHLNTCPQLVVLFG